MSKSAFNFNSPQARGLVLWLPAVGSEGATLRDARLDNSFAGNGTAVVAACASGIGARSGVSGGVAQRFANTTLGNLVAPITVVLRTRIISRSGAEAYGLFGKTASKGGASGVAFGVGENDPSDPYFSVNGTRAQAPTGIIADNTEYLLVGTYDKVNIKLYVNGKLRATTAYTTEIATNSEPWSTIPYGLISSETRQFVLDARIYNRVLSASEVFALYDPRTRYDLFRTNVIVAASAPTEAPAAGAYTLALAQGSYAASGQATGSLAARVAAAAQGAYALTGQALAFALGYGATLAQGSYAASGQAAGTRAARTLSAAQGAYTLTGQPVAATRAALVALVQGAYALAGQALSPLTSRLVALAQGAYSLAGQAINFISPRLLALAQGAYAVTGQPVGAYAARVLAPVQGAYALTGQAINFALGGHSVTLEQGLYALAGQPAALLSLHRALLAQGSFALSGQSTGLYGARQITGAAGAFALSGQAATAVAAHRLTPAQGAYVLTGQAAGLTRGYRALLAVGTYAATGVALLTAITRRLALGVGTFLLTGQTVALTPHFNPTTFVLPLTIRRTMDQRGARRLGLPLTIRRLPS